MRWTRRDAEEGVTEDCSTPNDYWKGEGVVVGWEARREGSASLDSLSLGFRGGVEVEDPGSPDLPFLDF